MKNVPSTNMEEAGFMTNTLASHQGDERVAVASLFEELSSTAVHFYIQSVASPLAVCSFKDKMSLL